MREYELVLVFRTKLSDTDRKKLVTTITSWLPKAKVTSEKEMGSKALAYKIKQDLMGFYYDLVVETEEAIAADFEKKLLNTDNVLRHLLIRKK